MVDVRKEVVGLKEKYKRIGSFGVVCKDKV